jgi:hypothetical protein
VVHDVCHGLVHHTLFFSIYIIFNVIFYTLYGPHNTSFAKLETPPSPRREYLFPEGGITSVAVKYFTRSDLPPKPGKKKKGNGARKWIVS